MTVGDQQSFSASLQDQFGNAMASQPASFSWVSNGGGSIENTGLFISSTAGGPFVISAQDSGFTGTASVTVNPLTATVNLSDLNQTFDGSPKVVSASTTPPGLSVAITYDGSSTPPSNAGSYEVIATITETNYQGSATDTLVIDENVYAYWQSVNFTKQEILNGIADPTADSDGDGLAQIIEYALGTDPHIAEHDVTLVEVQEFAQDDARLMMRFDRLVGLQDITYIIEFSSDLKSTWSPATLQITPVSETTETVTGWDSLPADQHPRRFVRLRVEP
jgi:hypothetical protein